MHETFKEDCLFDQTHLLKWVKGLYELNEVYFDYAFPMDKRQDGMYETGQQEQHSQSRPRSSSADSGAMATSARGSAKRIKTSHSEEQPNDFLRTELAHVGDGVGSREGGR